MRTLTDFSTHRVKVFLKSGVELITECLFSDHEDPEEEIEAEIDSRDSTWKTIGHLTLRFDQIAGFAVEEL